MDRFRSALDTCVTGWQQGNEAVLLQFNIKYVFGDMLIEYFERSLVEHVGQPINFVTMNSGSGSQTLVQMPKKEQVRPQLKVQSNTVEQATVRAKPTTLRKPRTPRPMNCWIIFRDAMHKKLKTESPHLTVQEISTRCSQIWHSLTPAEKQPWQSAAKSAKEEHLRLHPEYKYNPRRPGEKKKRQTRKAKQAAKIVTDPGLFNFHSVPDMSPLACELVPAPPSVTYEATTIFDDVCSMDTAQLTELSNILSMGLEDLPPIEITRDAECLRQDRLEAEFGTDIETSLSFDLLDDDSFPFRVGADGNVTLPSFYSNSY